MTTAFSIDGAPATADDLAHQALAGYGACTSFRVENGAARGLGLHLARLDAAAVELFGAPVGETRLRDLAHRALGERAEAWMRISLFSRHVGHRSPDWTGAPSVMVGVFDPPSPLPVARVQPQVHARHAPHLKTTATFDLIAARRTARAAGFDDAVFVDGEGRIAEGTLWTLGLVAGDTVVWPDAPRLSGVTERLADAGLATQGLISRHAEVRLDDLSGFDAAFLCNSATPAAPILSIGGHAMPERPDLIERLAAAWRSAPPEPL